MILIATDEAGYGPKLGPLVVAATTWQLPDGFEHPHLQEAFGRVAGPQDLNGRSIRVDDSKAVFQPHSADGYGMLEKVTLAACRWTGCEVDNVSLLKDLAEQDIQSVSAAPWLSDFATESVPVGDAGALVSLRETGSARLIGARARVLTARQFNRQCDQGMNKSDLLSSTTLSLVKDSIDELSGVEESNIAVFCDRHGGRRYYAGPIQASFDGTLVRVIQESKTESSYRVPYTDGEFAIRFTVKGDAFTPVAFSSMIGKYLREKAMESLNAFFEKHHVGDGALKPTAGYPVDADRFLADVAETVADQGIAESDLIRSR